MKSQALAAMGETDLETPGQIHEALAANERLKYYFSLLQMAIAQADHPETASGRLRHERLACGIDEVTLDELVPGARRENGLYRIPGCSMVLDRIAHDLPLLAAPVQDHWLKDRMARIIASLPHVEQDRIARDNVSAIAGLGSGAGDTLHQFVIDVHKALNALQAQLAEESLDGAAVYRIDEDDRPAIQAFMKGLNRTAWLKFDHPGLATTATRAGERLVIQNDLGTTDAHVLVIHVQGLTADVSCTDLHPERLDFFKSMLGQYLVTWQEDRLGQAGASTFHVASGRFEAADQSALLAYLEFLGSRLVFLIDWNRARKELRAFLRKEQRLELLRWAAENEIGQRGFLELGGARLVNRAIEATAGSAMHFGDRLCDVLSPPAAIEFLRFVFRAATEGLRKQQSRNLIRDRIQAELQVHFRSEGKRLLDLAGEHAQMIFEIASLIRDGVRGISTVSSPDGYSRLAKRARKFEQDADQLVIMARVAVQRRPEYAPLFRILEAADDAADEIEEAAPLVGLLVDTQVGGVALDALSVLADLVVDASQHWIQALIYAAHVDAPNAAPEDMDGFLSAIDQVFEIERQADIAERSLKQAVVQHSSDFRQLHLYAEMGRSLEAAADSLKSVALKARDHVLGHISGA